MPSEAPRVSWREFRTEESGVGLLGEETEATDREEVRFVKKG